MEALNLFFNVTRSVLFSRNPRLPMFRTFLLSVFLILCSTIFLSLTAIASTKTPSETAIQTKSNAKVNKKPAPKKKQASMPLAKLRVTSKFGKRIHPILNHPDFHAGVDLAAHLDDQVKSISEGVVTYAAWKGALGNAVYVLHPKLKITSIYGHLNKVAVRRGQKVSAGQIVGYAGTTGRSTGVHLHLTLKDQKTGRSIEPVRYLAKLQKDSVPVQAPVMVASAKRANKKPVAIASANLPEETGPELSPEEKEKLKLRLNEAVAKSNLYEQLFAEGAISRNDTLSAKANVEKLREMVEAG